jgi:chromosomal replication initiator protein
MMDLALRGYSMKTLLPWGKISAEFRRAPKLPATIKRIQATVAAHYDIPAYEMVSARRAREVAHPRQVAMFLTRELTPKSLPDIGRYFGGRDHTTVMHALAAVTERMSINDEIAEDVAMLRRALA